MKRYSGTIKLISLLVALPVFLWLAAFTKTHRQYVEYRSLVKSQRTAPITENTVMALPEQSMTSEALLGKVESYASEMGVVIVNYVPSIQKQEAGISLYVSKIQAKGRFIPLLKIVRSLEQTKGVGISSVSFCRKSKKESAVLLDMELVRIAKDE